MFDTARRRKLVKWLERFAYRIQYSVFCVNGDEARIERIRNGVERATAEEDSVFIFPVGNAEWKAKNVYGSRNSGLELCDASFIAL